MSCISQSYTEWIADTAYTCNVSSTQILGQVFISSKYSSQYIVRPLQDTLDGEEDRIFVGAAIVLSNVLLLAFLNIRPNMRRKYIFYTIVTCGDILDGSYLIYPSVRRLYEMGSGIFYSGTSLWMCAVKGYMIERIFGTELVATAMLIMSAEKLFAVLATLQYRNFATNKNRYRVAAGIVLFCFLSLLSMFITSYLDPRPVVQVDNYCGISGSVTDGFALWHQNYNLVCQILAFLFSMIAFLVARRLTRQAAGKELNAIKPILVASFITCILISANNIVYLLKNFTSWNISKNAQNVVVTYSPAIFQVTKFALYLLTGKEFRDCLRTVFIKDSGAEAPAKTMIGVKQQRRTTNTDLPVKTM